PRRSSAGGREKEQLATKRACPWAQSVAKSKSRDYARRSGIGPFSDPGSTPGASTKPTLDRIGAKDDGHRRQQALRRVDERSRVPAGVRSARARVRPEEAPAQEGHDEEAGGRL